MQSIPWGLVSIAIMVAIMIPTFMSSKGGDRLSKKETKTRHRR
jgi:hypothetical protein